MKEFDKLNIKDYNNLSTDYKAEVIAYNIWKYYKEVDYVFLKKLGSNNRSFHKDLKAIKEEYIDLNEKIISVESYREGIYDYMPEGVFHPPSLKGKGQNITEVVEQIRYEKRIEKKAREFFQPFELEIYFSHLKALELSDSFDVIADKSEFLNMIEQLWPLLKSLDLKSAKIFACLLPYFHSARGKKSWIEKCLGSFLNIPVKVSFTPNKISELDDLSSELVLSEIRLGLSSVLTGDHFDGERNWKFSFGPIKYEDLHLYLNGSPLRQLLDVIYDYCLPVTVTVEQEFITNRNENSFKIENNNNSLLGYSTYL